VFCQSCSSCLTRIRKLNAKITRGDECISNRRYKRDDSVLAHCAEQRRVRHKRLSTSSNSNLASATLNDGDVKPCTQAGSASDCHRRSRCAVDDLPLSGAKCGLSLSDVARSASLTVPFCRSLHSAVLQSRKGVVTAVNWEIFWSAIS
jgi:hypothetical protein